MSSSDIFEQVRWGGRNQVGAGNTVGEEVEQVNSFLSRAALTTKYMTKSGWLKRKTEKYTYIILWT